MTEASPPVTEMSSSVKVAPSIGSPKSTATVTDAALVGEAVSVDRVGPKAVLSKVTESWPEAVLPFPAGSVTRSAGIVAVMVPSEAGVTVKAYCWVVAPSWARTEASPPVTEMSSSVKVAPSIGSPKSTVTMTDAALVGEAVSVDRVGAGAALSKVIDRVLEAVLPFPAGSVTRSAGIVAVMVPSEAGVTVKAYCWVVAPSWARTEASPPVTEMSSSVKVAPSIGSPKSTVTMTDAALVGEAVSVDRVGAGAALSKVIDRVLEAVLPFPAGSVTRSAGIVAVMVPSEAGVTVKAYCWVVAPSWARPEASPPVTEMSSSVKVAPSIGSPKSTVTMTDAALVGEAVSVDRVGAGAALSKVIDRVLEAVLLFPAGP